MEATYESQTDKRGRKMVYEVKEGSRKLVAGTAIPDGAVVRDLDVETGPLETYVTEDQHDEIPDEILDDDRNCMLQDGKAGVMRRLVNGKLRYLCEDDYYNVTLGELVAYLRDSGRA